MSDTAAVGCCTYILPIRSSSSQAESDLADYVRRIAVQCEVIVVDGSPPEIFAEHTRAWGEHVRHVQPDPALVTPMGKVGAVLTGVRLASHERLIIADDDVRYDSTTLERVADALGEFDVVRPQNYFNPLRWHALWDTGRTLLNRATGGDWPGTIAVRRSILQRTGGYDGRAMFENLELVRTVLAAGGREKVLLDALVARRPSTSRHFWSQRVRQAYDEFARPARLVAQLALLPALVWLTIRYGWIAPAIAALVTIALAEMGRQRGEGTRVFPVAASLMAPAWVAERAVCSWLAVGARLVFGGVPYRGAVLRHAASSLAELQTRPWADRSSVDPSLRPAPRRQSA